MKKIIQIKLRRVGTQIIEVPKKSEILTAKYTNKELILYVLSDAESENEKRYIYMYDDEHNVTYQEERYIATVDIDDGWIVHIFTTLSGKAPLF